MKHFNKKRKGKKHKFTFTCDICFTQNVLDRHMKNIHGDFSQIEKGIKRKDKKISVLISCLGQLKLIYLIPLLCLITKHAYGALYFKLGRNYEIEKYQGKFFIQSKFD